MHTFQRIRAAVRSSDQDDERAVYKADSAVKATVVWLRRSLNNRNPVKGARR